MNSHLTTIAVGGLAAGKVLSGDGSYTAVCHTKAIDYDDVRALQNPMEAITLHQSYYKRMELRYRLANGEERGFQFWVDEKEIRNEHDLINALANGYRPVCNIGR